MSTHQHTLARAIDFEVEMLGAAADLKQTLMHTPREMLGLAREYLTGARPHLSDVLHFIEKTQHDVSTLEAKMRLIELGWRIRKEWRLI